MPAKLNFFKTPASERLVSSRSVSTSTGISGCFQPGQARVGMGPTPLVQLQKVQLPNVQLQNVQDTKSPAQNVHFCKFQNLF